MDSTLLKTINGEIINYRSKLIQLVPGFYFNQWNLLQNIFFYYNSRFMSGATDDEGDRKYFLNINRSPCKKFTQGIDFDTKDIKLITAGGGEPIITWWMERDLAYWMRDQDFDMVLNRIFEELPIYGTVVLKVVEGKVYFVDLRNFIVDQGADSLDQMRYKTEIHYYTPREFRLASKKMNWKKSDMTTVIELFNKMKDTSHIRVYERYGEVELVDNDGNKTYEYHRSFVADVGIDEYNVTLQQLVQYPGVQLSSEVWDKDPYWEFHKAKIPGRWLGVGIVEELLEPQIKQNEIVNLQSKAAPWRALTIFQTADPAFNRNLSTDVSNGEVLNADSPITQVNVQDMNLAFFNEETSKWERNADDLTIAFAPKGNSKTALMIAQEQVTSYYADVQQLIATRIKDLIYEVIMPQFEKDSTPEHTIRLIGSDLDQYCSFVKNELVLKELTRQFIMGKMPTADDKATIEIAVEMAIKQGKEKMLTVPKGFYKNAKYDIDIDIMGMSVDVKARYATMFAILQAVTSDPTAITDPAKRKILFGMAEMGGVNPNDLFDSLPDSNSPTNMMDNTLPQNTRAGGGVSSPMQMGDMAQGQAQTTV